MIAALDLALALNLTLLRRAPLLIRLPAFLKCARRTRAALPGAPVRGVVFSWLLLFWTSKREVTRPPQEDETLLKL
jgi:hypothetical protein